MTKFTRAAGVTVAALLLASAASAQNFAGGYGGIAITSTNGDTEAPWGWDTDLTEGDDSHDIDGKGFMGILGYNWQSGAVVYGIEGAVGNMNTEGDDAFNSGALNGTKMGANAYLAGRVGFATGNMLFYGSLGASVARTKLPEYHEVDGPLINEANITHSGTRAALGMEYVMGPGMLRAEVAHTQYNKKVVEYGYYIQSKPEVTTATIGYLVKF